MLASSLISTTAARSSDCTQDWPCPWCWSEKAFLQSPYLRSQPVDEQRKRHVCEGDIDPPKALAAWILGVRPLALSFECKSAATVRNHGKAVVGKTACSPTDKVRDALGPIIQIVTIAAEMAGDESRATIWFKHQPVPGWAGKTAFDLVGEGGRVAGPGLS